MSRFFVFLLIPALLLGRPEQAMSQRLARPAIGAGVGIAGGAVITMSAVVFSARFQREYIDSIEDLIDWRSIPMIATPAVGVMFGLAGEEALKGSIIGSASGMVTGAALGVGVGWLTSEQPEAPWAGGVIGAGIGMTVGGLALGFSRWAKDEEADLEFPGLLRLNLSVPVSWGSS